jgi:hypothetical protein
MSNRQLGWDDMRIRDRVSPSEIAEGNKEQMEQQEAELEQQSSNDDRWVPPGNPDQGSRKK